MLCSEWVPSEWESKHNNPQVIHTISVLQLTSCEAKNSMFLTSLGVLILYWCFWRKSIIHNNASSSEKVHLLFFSKNPPTYLFRIVFTCKRCLICAHFSPDSDKTTYFPLGKTQYCGYSFSLRQTLSDGLEWCGLLVHYCDVFISCLDSHSDGTHSLQSIHCWVWRKVM